MNQLTRLSIRISWGVVGVPLGDRQAGNDTHRLITGRSAELLPEQAANWQRRNL